MSGPVRLILILLPATVLALPCTAAAAGPTKPAKKAATVDSTTTSPSEELQAAARQAEQDPNLSAEDKKRLAEVYRQALDEWQAVDEWREKRAQYEAARQTAPRELEKLKARASSTA